MIYFLFSFSHKEVGKTKDWVFEAANKDNRQCIWLKRQLRKVYLDSTRPKIINKIIAKGMIYQQCLRVIVKSHNSDIIVCFDQETGLILNDFLVKFKLDRKIIIMGWLVPSGDEKSKPSYFRRLALAMGNRNCINIVNYEDGKEQWLRLIHPQIDNFEVIHDVINKDIGSNETIKKCSKHKFVFVGG